MKTRKWSIEDTRYWRCFRQGVREKGRHKKPAGQGTYSRRKRNNDLRFGARMNERHLMPDDLRKSCNRKFRRRFKGAIRRQREAVQIAEAFQQQLRREVLP